MAPLPRWWVDTESLGRGEAGRQVADSVTPELPLRTLWALESELRRLVACEPCLPANLVRRQPRDLALGALGDQGDAFGHSPEQSYKVLALQVELCLPRPVSSPAPGGSIDGLRAFSRNPGRRASPVSLLLSERLPSEGA
jgi:hypothetical protein